MTRLKRTPGEVLAAVFWLILWLASVAAAGVSAWIRFSQGDLSGALLSAAVGAYILLWHRVIAHNVVMS